MPALTYAWTTIADTAVDPDSPVDTALMTGIAHNLVHLRELVAGSFTAGAVQDHNHDGANSALIEVGPNYARNGSFETAGTSGWTTTAYTGGTVATNTANEMDGATALAITSTVLANGGGDATSAGFVAVTGSGLYDFRVMVKASAVNISSKAEVIWYDDAQAQVSVSTIYTSTNTETAAKAKGNRLRAPATARYAKIKLTGGIPASGSSTGTIYFDGFVWFVTAPILQTGSVVQAASPWESSTTNATYTKVKEIQVPYDGDITVGFDLKSSAGAANGRIYKNGVAVGTERTNGTSTYASFNEDVIGVAGGDLIQIYAKDSSSIASVANFKISAQVAYGFAAVL